jgi:tetrahydromethanopterin S-methyltransferase subunit G
MNDVVKQEYLDSFETLFKYHVALTESIAFKSSKYLEKLIPFSRRCALPRMEMDDLNTITITYEDGEKTQEQKPFVDEILTLLYKKTGLILLKDQDGCHAFLPNSLRSLVHLIGVLINMADVSLISDTSAIPELSEEDKLVLESNVETLIILIVDNYAIELPDSSKKILQCLAYTPWKRLNQKTMQMISKELKQQQLIRKLLNSEQFDYINNVADNITVPENVTVGDVLFGMRWYSKTVHFYDVNPDKFVSLFKVLYSLRAIQTLYLIAPSGTKTKKDNLFQMLGGLIYNPDYDKVVTRGQSWCQEKNIRVLYDGNLKDVIWEGMVYTGLSSENAKIRTTNWLRHRVECDEAYYNKIDLNSGNRFQYFTFDYLACITNALKTDLYITTEDFADWKKKYISPLPILSADFIDFYINNLAAATKNADSDNAIMSKRIRSGTDKLFKEALKKICNDKKLKEWLENSYINFPFLKENAELDSYLDNPISYEMKETPKSPAVQIERINNFIMCLDRLNRCKERFENINNREELSRRIFVDRRGLFPAEYERIGILNGKINEKKYYLKNKSGAAEDDFKQTIDAIVQLLNDEINQVQTELNTLQQKMETMWGEIEKVETELNALPQTMGMTSDE